MIYSWRINYYNFSCLCRSRETTSFLGRLKALGL